jgi:hypothetical protein
MSRYEAALELVTAIDILNELQCVDMVGPYDVDHVITKAQTYDLISGRPVFDGSSVRDKDQVPLIVL